MSFAAKNLRAAGVTNARVVEGDGAQGFGRDMVDIIVLGGSTPVLPPALLEQLKPGGRMFAVVGDAPVMAARLISKASDGALASVTLFETNLAPLVNAAQPPRFKF